MGETRNNYQDFCAGKCKHENKFVIMADDTEECDGQERCDKHIVQGYPIQQVYIDLSDCKNQTCKQDMCSKKEK